MALRKPGKILLYLGAAALGIIGILLLGVTLALDRVPHYQAEIKDWVHQHTGYRIAFAHVSPAFRWYGPELYFDRLELRTGDGTRLIARAGGGRIGFDVWELVRSGKLFAGRVELDAPTLDIERSGPAEFSLGSQVILGEGEGALPPLRLDDLPAGTLAIRHGRVTVRHWNTALPELPLEEVNLTLRRGADGAALRLAARLPPVLGGEVSITGSARGAGALDTLAWTGFARTRHLALAGWRELLPEFLTRLGGGTGGFEVAARGQGAGLTRADLEFDASGVSTRMDGEPSVTFDQIGGALSIIHNGDRWTLLGRALRAQSGGRQDPQSAFDVTWRGNEAGLTELKARASYVRLEALLPLAGLLPQKDLREQLQEVAPTGEWFDTQLDLERGSAADPWRFDVHARFRGVGFAPVGRAPGLRGLDGMIAGTDTGGHVQLEGRQAVFTWPFELPQPLDLTVFKTALYWKRTPAELLVATPSFEIQDPDGRLHAQVAWRQPADGSGPLLTLAGGLEDGDVAATHRYLPRALLAPPVLAWLNQALVGGRLSHADLIFQGPVRHFPFRDGTGLFLARAHLEGMTLDYREGWPTAQNLSVIAEFRNEGLTVKFAKGSVGNLTVDQADARFVDFKTAQLELRAAGAGDAAAVLDFLRATPLNAAVENGFSGVDASGPLQIEVNLTLPFSDWNERRILVHTHLHGVSLRRAGSSLAATELTGDADIDGAQVARADLKGKLLGGMMQIQGRAPRGDPSLRTRLQFNGSLSGEALQAALGLPAAVAIGGTTDWHGVLSVAADPARERSLHLSASLTNLDLALPEPLAKPAGTPLPSTLDVLWPAAGATQVRLTLGSLLRTQLTLDSDPGGPRLGRLAVSFGPGSELPSFSETQVLNAGGRIGRLDLGGWLKLYTPDRNAKPLGNFLRSAKLQVDEIDYLGLVFRDVALDLAVGDVFWRIGVDGPNVAGSIQLPAAADSTEPWQLEFRRLRFSAAEAPAKPAGEAHGDAGAAAGAGGNPRSVPALKFHAADVVWGERQLGEVSGTLKKLDDGIGVPDLKVTGATFALHAMGEWRGAEAGAGRLEGTATSTDVGATLKQLGYAAVIEAKDGKMDFDMSWLGAPSSATLADATGHVQITLDKGQITGIKPGAGRVVGLASVAALPRRLALDFSDLTDKGFAFDTARGSFDLRGGSAYTDDVLVKGPAAEIGLIGRVGLKNKDYDQTAVVTGNVGSSLALAAFAGGPVIGGAVLVFSQVFKQPLKGLARGYYRITGSWDNPTVERIKGAGAAAATAEAPKSEAPK